MRQVDGGADEVGGGGGGDEKVNKNITCVVSLAAVTKVARGGMAESATSIAFCGSCQMDVRCHCQATHSTSYFIQCSPSFHMSLKV